MPADLPCPSGFSLAVTCVLALVLACGPAAAQPAPDRPAPDRPGSVETTPLDVPQGQPLAPGAVQNLQPVHASRLKGGKLNREELRQCLTIAHQMEEGSLVIEQRAPEIEAERAALAERKARLDAIAKEGITTAASARLITDENDAYRAEAARFAARVDAHNAEVAQVEERRAIFANDCAVRGYDAEDLAAVAAGLPFPLPAAVR